MKKLKELEQELEDYRISKSKLISEGFEVDGYDQHEKDLEKQIVSRKRELGLIDERGFDKSGFNVITKTKFDINGFDINGNNNQTKTMSSITKNALHNISATKVAEAKEIQQAELNSEKTNEGVTIDD